MRWSSHNSFLTQLISAQLVGYGIFVALFSHTSGCGEDQWCNVPCSTLMTLSPYRRFYSFLSDSYICCGSRSWYQSAFGLDTPTSKGRSFSFPKSTCIYVQSCFRSFICPSTREKYPFPVISEFQKSWRSVPAGVRCHGAKRWLSAFPSGLRSWAEV